MPDAKRRIISSAVAVFFVFVSQVAFAQEVKTGTISGQIMTQGGAPMSEGMVFFFNAASGPPPSRQKYWRIPDSMANTDANGKFSAELRPGKYYLGAKKGASLKDIGPPRDGDLFYASEDEKGAPHAHVVETDKRTDIGVVSGATPFRRDLVKFGDGITAVEGVIIDPENKPVAGALVFAFITPTMVGRPLFTSEKTGEDGRYILRVYEGGEYYLKVRSEYGGGPPVPGEFIGLYGDSVPAGVKVRTGEIVRDINIKIKKFVGRATNKAGTK